MISNDLRLSIGDVECAQLVASCSLVHAIDPSTIGKSNVNLAKIDLDPAVQKAISDAQAKFAQVSAAQADLKQAQIQAQTNTARQQGYNSCLTVPT